MSYLKKLLVFVFAFFACNCLLAAPIKELVFFGDSLTDNGNLYRLAKIIPESPPYYQGRFSNGPTWAETVGNYFHQKDQLPYAIYAYGGATALDSDSLLHNSGPRFSLSTEMAEFNQKAAGLDKSKALYIIWIGANDYLFNEKTAADSLSSAVVNQITSAMTALNQEGAEYFLIINLPDLDKIPFAYSHHLNERLHLLTALHNEKLGLALKAFKLSHQKAKVILLNVNHLMAGLLTDTAKYNNKYQLNLKDVTEACWQGNISPTFPRSTEVKNFLGRTLAPCDNPEQHLFWDQIHPTETVHQLLAKVTIETLHNPNQFSIRDI